MENWKFYFIWCGGKAGRVKKGEGEVFHLGLPKNFLPIWERKCCVFGIYYFAQSFLSSPYLIRV